MIRHSNEGRGGDHTIMKSVWAEMCVCGGGGAAGCVLRPILHHTSQYCCVCGGGGRLCTYIGPYYTIPHRTVGCFGEVVYVGWGQVLYLGPSYTTLHRAHVPVGFAVYGVRGPHASSLSHVCEGPTRLIA